MLQTSATQIRGGLLKAAMEQVADDPISLNSKSSRGRGSGTISMPFFVVYHGLPEKTGGYQSFGGYPLLRFSNLKKNEKMYSLSPDGTRLTFNLPGGQKYYLCRDTHFFVSVLDSVKVGECKVGSWWWIEGFGVSRYMAKSGAVGINISAGNITPWEDAPDVTQMFDLLSQTFDPLHCNIRPIPSTIFPQLDINEARDAIKTDPDLNEDQRKVELKKFNDAFKTKATEEIYKTIASLHDNGTDDDLRYFVELLDTYKTGVKRATAPARRIYLPVSQKSRQMAEELDRVGGYETLTMAHQVQWGDTMFIKNKEGKFSEQAKLPKVKGKEVVDDRVDKRMVVIRGVARVLRVDKGNVESLTVNMEIWNSPMMDALGIFHYDICENLFVQRMNEFEMVVSGRVSPYGTWDMDENQNIDRAPGIVYPGLQLPIDTVAIDYRHFFNHMCCRVNSQTAIDLFKFWMNRRFKINVTSKECLRTNVMLMDKNVPADTKKIWNYYLKKGSGSSFEKNITSVEKRVMNMMGSEANELNLEQVDNYRYFVFAAGRTKDEHAAMLEAHADPQNNEHLDEISDDMSEFCKTGNSKYFTTLYGAHFAENNEGSSSSDEVARPGQKQQGVEFQLYVIDVDYFNNVIMQPYTIPPFVGIEDQSPPQPAPAATPTCSSSEWVERASSDLLEDDEGRSVLDIVKPQPLSSVKDDEDEDVKDEGLAETTSKVVPAASKSKRRRG